MFQHPELKSLDQQRTDDEFTDFLGYLALAGWILALMGWAGLAVVLAT